jgi:hypothetical protein
MKIRLYEYIDCSDNWNASIVIETEMYLLLSKLEFIDCYKNSSINISIVVTIEMHRL